MGSNTPQLPVLDFSDKTLKPGNSNWSKACSDVRKALEDYGCFEASYDGVSMDLQKSFLEAMEKLFDLPLEAKKRNVCPKPFIGYLTHNNLSESFGIEDANILEKVEEFTQQLDGVGNKSISETIQKFAKELAEVDVMVRKMIMESFGIDQKYIDEHLNSTNYRVRLMKYIASPNADDDVEKKLGLPSHTDKNLLTTLFQHEIEGLEMKTKDDKWIRVKPSPNSFIVLIGDSLSALMNGRLSAPHHRVRVTEKKKTRYSAGLFTHPNGGYIIEPPKELIDENHPRLFKPFDYVDFLHFFISEAGRKASQFTLKAYCGVSGA